MRSLIPLLGTLLLAGCVAPMTKEQFLAAYQPIPGRIAKFDHAAALAYQPHVRAPGLEAVNDAVNAMPYMPDPPQQHDLDPEKFWRAGGDCDKYALVKMLELRAQGINDVFYLVLVNGPHHDAHAVLVADDHGAMVALDNQWRSLRPLASLYMDYQPAYFIDARTRRLWRARGYFHSSG